MNGSFALEWKLPPELGAVGDQVLVEVNVTGEWVSTKHSVHFISEVTADRDTLLVYLRVSQGQGAVHYLETHHLRIYICAYTYILMRVS